MSRSLRKSLIVGVVFAFAAAACGGDGGEGGGGGGGGTADDTLRVAYQADISSFDPDNSFEIAGLGAIGAVYQGLVGYAPGTTDIEGVLAESWTVSDDGLTYTFDLRDGVVFHDGSPMTAQAVLDAFERRRSDEALILSYFLAYGVAEFSAPDDDTFVIVLNGPDPAFLDNLSSPWGPKVIGPDALVANAGDDNSRTYLNENADGTGPFRLASFDRGQGYLLERFDDYWGPAPYFAAIDIRIIPDIGQQVLQVQSGELDMVLHGYPFDQLGSLPEGLEVFTYNDLGIEMAYVNPTQLETTEQRLKVMAAIDPSAWVADAFGAYAEPARSLFPKAMIDPANPVAWPSLADYADVTVPPIDVVYTAEEAAVQQRVADLLVAQLTAAGIEATARPLPQDQVTAFPSDPASGPTIVLAQNNPDSAHPSTQTFLFYQTGGPLNIFQYSNPAADDLFGQAYGVTDVAERDALYLQGAQLLFDDGGFYPLADVQDVIVYRSGLTGLAARPAIPWTIDFGLIARGG